MIRKPSFGMTTDSKQDVPAIKLICYTELVVKRATNIHPTNRR